MKNTNDIKVNNPIIMKTNIVYRNTKGFELVIFKVQDMALHVTVKNLKSVHRALDVPVTFSVILRELQDFYETTFGKNVKIIGIKENRKHQDPTENQIIIILK